MVGGRADRVRVRMSSLGALVRLVALGIAMVAMVGVAFASRGWDQDAIRHDGATCVCRLE